MAADDPKDLGSGKYRRPCDRIHLEYSTSDPPEDEPGETAVVVVRRLPTPARGEPAPPQPAASSETAATATTDMKMSGPWLRTPFASFQSRAKEVHHHELNEADLGL